MSAPPVHCKHDAIVGKEGIVVTDGEGHELAIREGALKNKKPRHFRVPAGDPVAQYIHPNQKPVALAARALKNSSLPGAIVVDCFAGSGSTLIACEQMGRSARCIEKCPLHAAAIIERWHTLTKRAPGRADPPAEFSFAPQPAVAA